MEDNLEKTELVELTAEIVSAYVSNNTVVASDLPGVIQNAVSYTHLTLPTILLV